MRDPCDVCAQCGSTEDVVVYRTLDATADGQPLCPSCAGDPPAPRPCPHCGDKEVLWYPWDLAPLQERCEVVLCAFCLRFLDGTWPEVDLTPGQIYAPCQDHAEEALNALMHREIADFLAQQKDP